MSMKTEEKGQCGIVRDQRCWGLVDNHQLRNPKIGPAPFSGLHSVLRLRMPLIVVSDHYSYKPRMQETKRR